jgi:autotransporter-associated beta strand protein/parallel beta-helix repeat protein
VCTLALQVDSYAGSAGLRNSLDYSVANSAFIETPTSESVVSLVDTSGSIATLQATIDAARTANPDQLIIIRLKSNTTYEVLQTPLTLGSRMCLSGSGTSIAATSNTTASSLVSITPGSTLVSVDRLTLEGASKALYGINASGVSRVNIDRVTVRETGLDGIYLEGLGSTTFNNEITVTRCTVTDASSAAGIHLKNTTQGIVMNNACFNNTNGILIEASEHGSIFNNESKYNSFAGIRLLDTKNTRGVSNLCNGNSKGIATQSTSAIPTYTYNFIIKNEITSCSTGVSIGQSRDVYYGNEFPAGVTVPMAFSSGAINRIVQTTSLLAAPNQEYFYPPTSSNFHSEPVKNNQARTDVVTDANTLSAIQALYDEARANNPGTVVVLRLTAPEITGNAPLTLYSDTCIVLDGTIKLNPGIAAFLAGTSNSSQSYISVSGGVIDGQNTTGRNGMTFTYSSKILVKDVTLRNFGDKNTRATGSDIIVFAGCKDPCIVDSCTLDGGASRGIWTRGITASSLSGMVFIDNTISDVNMDGIDFDIATSSSTALYNTSKNNIRYGIFIEEGSKYVQAIGNTCSGNDIGINFYAYDAGPTEKNLAVANTLSANKRGLRFGSQSGFFTQSNFAFNNRISSSTSSAIDAQNYGSENYLSENTLSENAADLASLTTCVFFNPPASNSEGVDNAAFANTDFTENSYATGNLVSQQGWLTFGNSTTGPIQVTGGAAKLIAGSNYQSTYKSISPYQFTDNSSVFIRVDINVKGASANGTDFFVATREIDAATGQPNGKNYFRLYTKASGTGFQLGWNPHAETSATVPSYSDTVFQFDTNYSLVIRNDSKPNRKNDKTDLFVNPTAESAVALLSKTTWDGNASDEFSASTSSGNSSGLPRIGGYLNLKLTQQNSTGSSHNLGVQRIVVADSLTNIGIKPAGTPISLTGTDYTNNSTSGNVTFKSSPGWSPSVPSSKSTTTLTFSGALSGNTSISNDFTGNFNLNSLNLANTGSGNMTFSGQTLQFVSAESDFPTLRFSSSLSIVQLLNNNLQLDSTLYVTQGSGSTSYNCGMAGLVSGSGGLAKAGTGRLDLLNMANSFSGAVELEEGTLCVSKIGMASSSSSLGSNRTIHLGAASGINWIVLRYTGTGELSDKTLNLLGTTGAIIVKNSGSGTLKFTSPLTATGSGSRTLYPEAYSPLEFAGSIPNPSSGTTGLVLAGSGTVTLSAANSFTGGVTIRSGTLSLAHANALASGNISLTGSATLKMACSGMNASLGNLMVSANSTLDLGSDTSSSITLASASGWTTGKSLTIANSSGGKLYIKDASNLDLAQIISQENPTYSASLQADGLLVFTAPSVGITYSSWLAASGQNATSTTLLEYAWGAASVGALQSQNLPTYTLSSPRFVLNYVVRKNANVTVTPELSLSLSGVSSNFASSPLITEVSEGFSTVDGVDIEHREASINLNEFAPKAFLRLRVSIPSQATP